MQQVGYTYCNLQPGFELPLGPVTMAVQGGYAYMRVVVHAPDAVTPDVSSPVYVRLVEDGHANVHTWSAKIALVYWLRGI